MVKKKNEQRIMKEKQEKAIFLFFLNYEYEEDFPLFLVYLREKLGIDVGEPEELVYLLVAESKMKGIQLTAAYGTDSGCYLVLDPDMDALADEIIMKCTS